jgi:hypothetical protein
MKVKSILRLVNDVKLYIEFIDEESGASYGFYTIKDLIYNDKFYNYIIKSINVQYYNNKRLLVIYI